MKYLGICSVILLGGCATSDGLSTLAQSENNVVNLTRISVGMDEATVMQIMHPPHSEETYTLEKDQYDVWFYVTNPTVLGQTRLVHFNLTPLTFKNDHLASVGWDYYKWVKKQVAQAPVKPPQPKEATIEEVLGGSPNATEAPAAEENKPLEEALQPSQSEQTPAPAQQPASAPAPEEPAAQPPVQESPPEQQPVSQPTPEEEKAIEESEQSSTPAEAPKCTDGCPGVLEAENDAPKKDEPEKEECPSSPSIDEKDEQMLQEGQMQDFNFW